MLFRDCRGAVWSGGMGPRPGITGWSALGRAMSERTGRGLLDLEADSGQRAGEPMSGPRGDPPEPRPAAHGERSQGSRISTRWSTPIPQAGQRRCGEISGTRPGAGSLGTGTGGAGSSDTASSCSRAWARRS